MALTYRPDIDGMRAVAVTLVLLYHLKIETFSGGYIGVDVFFVISGFLVTSIITRSIDKSEFTFSQFYLRRLRRLMPAALATIAVTGIVSAFILQPYEFKYFARTAIAALVWISNFIFYFESGYWDTASDLKPLLHTWSLGVEEQFYLIWPALIVLFCSSFGRRGLLICVALISAVSLLSNLWLVRVDPSAAFYLLPTRIFQFGFGAIIAFILLPERYNRLLDTKLVRDSLLLIGLSGVLIAAIFFDENTRYPGEAALLPTVATGLLILSGIGGVCGPLGTLILTNRFMVWLGRISYSTYLVHWPIIVLYRYKTGPDLNVLEILSLAIATLAMAAALYNFVEIKFYNRSTSARAASSNQNAPKFLFTYLSAAIALMISAGFVWSNGGLAWRFESVKLTAEEIEDGKRRRADRRRDGCRILTLSDPKRCNVSPEYHKVLVFGDSHETDGFNFIEAGYEDLEKLTVISFGTTNDCDDLEERNGRWRSSTPFCQRRLNILFDPETLEEIDIILYSALRPFHPNKRQMFGLLERLTELRPDLPIVVLGGFAHARTGCALVFNQTGSTTGCLASENLKYFGANDEQKPLFDEFMGIAAAYIDRVELLCEDRTPESCLTETQQGMPVFFDNNHFTLEYAEMAGRLYAEEHPDLLAKLMRQPAKN